MIHGSGFLCAHGAFGGSVVPVMGKVLLCFTPPSKKNQALPNKSTLLPKCCPWPKISSLAHNLPNLLVPPFAVPNDCEPQFVNPQSSTVLVPVLVISHVYCLYCLLSLLPIVFIFYCLLCLLSVVSTVSIVFYL